MILQVLKNYYDRKVTDPDSEIAPEGFEHKELPFIIVIDNEGNLIQIEDTRRQEKNKMRTKSFLVPRAQKRSSGIKANLLWDNMEYIFGISIKGKSKRVIEQQKSFLSTIKELELDDCGINAVLKFIEKSPISQLEKSEHANEIKSINPFMGFRLHNDIGLVSERKAVVDRITNQNNLVDKKQGVCLITGEKDIVTTLHASIKGVRGANTSGADIVSFNHPAFNSFGKAQGKNAPIGKKSSFCYVTALNYLLRKDSNQKIQIGDATTVFWSDKGSFLEDNFTALFNEPLIDNPDSLTNAVKSLYQSVEAGALRIEENETRFFVLGLSPNVARIAVRFWHTGTVADMSEKIAQHFRDLEITHTKHERGNLSLWRLLCSVAIQNDSKKIPPNLGGDWMRCILAGLSYPASLYQAALRRICTEHCDKKCRHKPKPCDKHGVNYPRAAVIKAYLNRHARLNNQLEEEILVSLDKENKNAGYRLGRLFSTLEKIQEESAGRDLNSSIRDRYYSTASSTPSNVMSTLMRLKNHHLAKLEKGRAIYFERLISDILADIVDFPRQLNLQDQGRFAIGYYHQRHDFFTKSENKGE